MHFPFKLVCNLFLNNKYGGKYECRSRSRVLNWVVTIGLLEKVTLEKSFGGSKGDSHVHSWKKITMKTVGICP